MRSTCACPARAARGTARPASTWRPTSRRPCPRSTPDRGASCEGRAPTTRSASCRAGRRMTPPKLANAMLRSKTVGRVAKSAAGVDQRRSLPRFSGTPAALGRDSAARGERRRLDLGRLVHRPLRRGHRPRGDPAAGDRWPAGSGDPRAGVLRTDLDHHRPAHRRAADRRPRRRDPAPLRRRAAPRSSPSSRAASRRSGRTPASWSTTLAPPR